MQRMTRLSAILLVAVLVIAALPTGNAFAIPGDTLPPIVSAVAAVPNPATLNTTVTVTATVDDSTTGGSNIASAQFTVNGGTPVDMTGTFNTSPTATVTGTYTVTQTGVNHICVLGTDDAGNVNDPVADPSACVDITVQSLYTFTGFFPPVRTLEKKAQAGRTIPLKWRLTLTADGSFVTDPSVFVAVKSYSVDCTTLVGDPTTAVIEKNPGKARLHYIANGRWRFNWKTLKAYRHSCRMMFVEFSDGSTSPSVLFRFR